jgi:glutaredoxin
MLHLVGTKRNSIQKSHLAAGVAPMRCRCGTSQGERTVSPRVSIYNRDMHDVVVYSRQGCHLCDVVKETLRKLQDKADYRWREVDIDADRELQQKYDDEAPVVLINGRKAFKYHMSERDFLRVLAERE